jgi:hypothetical protein
MAVPTAIRRASLEKVDAQADPTTLSGKADTLLARQVTARIRRCRFQALASNPVSSKSSRCPQKSAANSGVGGSRADHLHPARGFGGATPNR